MSRKGKVFVILIVIIFTFGLLFVISHFLSEALEGVELEEVELDKLNHLTIASSSDQLIKDTDYIVLGQYEGLNQTVNLYNQILQSPFDDQKMHLGGKIFQFNINEVLKGNIDSSQIKIAHIYSLPFEVEETLGFENKDAESVDPTYINPDFKNQYIVFLKKTNQQGIYIRKMEPFLYQIDPEDHSLSVKSQILDRINYKDNLTEKSLSDFKSDVKNSNND